jgi:hypothetical protein
VAEARDGVIVCSRTETEICQNGMFQVVTFREGKMRERVHVPLRFLREILKILTCKSAITCLWSTIVQLLSW